MDYITLLKMSDTIIKYSGFALAVLAGYLVYDGFASREEKLRYKLRVRRGLQKQKEKFIFQSFSSIEEELLKRAGYPLKVNGFVYKLFRISLLSILSLYYIALPLIAKGEVTTAALLSVLVILILTEPKFKYSAFQFILNKIIEFRQAKRNAEVFQLHDLLISEIDMMENHRVSTYSLLRSNSGYFNHIKTELTNLQMNWKNDPDSALDTFADEVGTKEATALASILKKLDENEHSVAVEALRSHADLFAKSQIENYRRKKKLFVDLGGLPIRTAHFLIIMNFLSIIVYMVLEIFVQTRVNL